MLSNLDTAWRYPLALLLGLLTGLYIGGMLATIYVITAFRESLDTLSPMGPWFLRYAWADLAERPSAGRADHHWRRDRRPDACRNGRGVSRPPQPV